VKVLGQDLEAGMGSYDPLVGPDPVAWLALDEDERMALVEAYHVRRKIAIPNMTLHTTAHAIVETQIAEGDALPVREKARQLMAQGLDRHDAVHAIASVLIAHLGDIAKGTVTEADSNRRYFSALRRLTARKWLRSG
jgi:hypothetical protein